MLLVKEAVRKWSDVVTYATDCKWLAIAYQFRRRDEDYAAPRT
jgi:hypothetical protein